MKRYKTEQEDFWNGKFGDEYIERNQGSKALASKIHIFSDVFTYTQGVASCLELGANIGLNLKAIKSLIPQATVGGVEINQKAANECRKIEGVEVFEQSILDFQTEKRWDFTFTAGVLIHINPDCLENVYDILYEHSNKYICLTEYYNPTPVEVSYRGNEKRLFKRDFAGEIMDRYPDLKLLKYGFIYHRDYNFPGDDLTWFLMEKKK